MLDRIKTFRGTDKLLNFDLVTMRLTLFNASLK